MKRSLLALVALVLAATPLLAEEMAKTEADSTTVVVVQPVLSPEMIKEAFSQDRRSLYEMALANLLPNKAQKSAFWDVYNAYEVEKSKVAERRLALIKEYANNFTSLSDKRIKALLKESYTLMSKDLKIRKKYSKQLEKKVNASVAGRFWQVDTFISSAVSVGLLSNMPLLGDKIQ
mgnify:CR=1 FL=1